MNAYAGSKLSLRAPFLRLWIGVMICLLGNCYSLTSIQAASDFEENLAQTNHCKPNPAVSAMDSSQYLGAIKKLHPALIPMGDDIRKAIEFGVARKKKTIWDVLRRWVKSVTQEKGLFTYSTTSVIPWHNAAEAVYFGWDQARQYRDINWEEAATRLPSHYLSFSVYLGLKDQVPQENEVALVLESEDGKHFQPASNVNSDIRSLQSNATQYTRTYLVYFDLLNSDGSPRITPADKSVILLIIRNGQERRVKFKIADWSVENLPSK